MLVETLLLLLATIAPYQGPTPTTNIQTKADQATHVVTPQETAPLLRGGWDGN